MVDMGEFDGRLAFLESKLGRVEDAVSGIYSGLATASALQRINGNLLIPESVVTDKVAELAITTTKINDDAVTTPKVIANAITANKLETRLVLSTEIVAGSYAAPNYNGVRLDSSGLRLYNGAGTQRGLLSSDGSGWFGTSTSFFWNTAGALTATGLTVASAASPAARVELDSTGLKSYDGSNRLQLSLIGGTGLTFYNPVSGAARLTLASDGSGWFGSSTGFTWDTAGAITATGVTVRSASTTAKAILDATGFKLINSAGTTIAQMLSDGSGYLGAAGKLSWNTTGVMTLDASQVTVSNLNATNITAGTITADFVSGGNLGGGFNLGTSDITVNSTGKIKFGASSADYLSNNLLHFEVGTSEVARIEIKNGANTPYATVSGAVTTTAASTYLTAFGGTSRKSQFGVEASSADATTLGYMTAFASGGTQGARYVLLSTGQHTWDVGDSTTIGMRLVATNRALSLYGYLYPGTGSATQATRYIYDDGTNIAFSGAVQSGSGVYYLGATTRAVSGSASSARLGHGSGYVEIDSSGRTVATGNIFPGAQTTYYVGLGTSALNLAGPVNFVNHTTGGTPGTDKAYVLMADDGAGTGSAWVQCGTLTVKIGGTNRTLLFFD